MSTQYSNEFESLRKVVAPVTNSVVGVQPPAIPVTAPFNHKNTTPSQDALPPVSQLFVPAAVSERRGAPRPASNFQPPPPALEPEALSSLDYHEPTPATSSYYPPPPPPSATANLYTAGAATSKHYAPPLGITNYHSASAGGASSTTTGYSAGQPLPLHYRTEPGASFSASPSDQHYMGQRSFSGLPGTPMPTRDTTSEHAQPYTDHQQPQEVATYSNESFGM